MPSYIRTVAVLLLCGLTLSKLAAQFVGYPTPDVPRNADGTLNWTAPAPRMPDGKPDLSGVWDHVATPCVINVTCDDRPVISEFGNIGVRLEGGLPFQPWAARLAEDRQSQVRQGRMVDPITLCQPSDFMRLITYPVPRKFIQARNVLAILSERDVTYRQVFLDGRTLPSDPSPSFHGNSIGHWDGDTLVIETNGLRDDAWLDRRGNPLTSEARITERYSRPDFSTLELELTVNDPKAYTKPWTIRLTQKMLRNDDLLEYFCQENEKDVNHILK